MLGCIGRVQREGLVVHVVAERLIDLSPMLKQVGANEGGVGHAVKVPTRDFR
jgi:hypothetical protein